MFSADRKSRSKRLKRNLHCQLQPYAFSHWLKRWACARNKFLVYWGCFLLLAAHFKFWCIFCVSLDCGCHTAVSPSALPWAFEKLALSWFWKQRVSQTLFLSWFVVLMLLNFYNTEFLCPSFPDPILPPIFPLLLSWDNLQKFAIAALVILRSGHIWTWNKVQQSTRAEVRRVRF